MGINDAKQVFLLDCTLRDGGYINNWKFGNEAICNIIKKLVLSKVEYIECGYLSEKKGKEQGYTHFKSLDVINKILPKAGVRDQKFAVMINYGEFEIDNISQATSGSPIIRVCFHKKEKEAALDFSKRLLDKGYEVFLQPMAASNYSSAEFATLIGEVNRIHPTCFYIVDSFGTIEIDQFKEILISTDFLLDSGIMLGYHSHNNLQQAYGNAKYMVNAHLHHDIVLDASVYGMGRGAGNLNMELFASYLNQTHAKSYRIDAFLEIVDEYLKPIFADHFWGYSLPFYLSARCNCHPNYASYYSDKGTLSNKSMLQLLSMLPDDVKNSFSPQLAEQYYLEYQKNNIDDRSAVEQLRNVFGKRHLLLLAPGKSLAEKSEEIHTFIREYDPCIVAINSVIAGYPFEYLFCSNEKRAARLPAEYDGNLILTSNISEWPSNARTIRLNYSSYLIGNGLITDNPVLMFIKLLTTIGIGDVYLAGFDGYSSLTADNYYDPSLAMGSSIESKLQKNRLITRAVHELSRNIQIHFITNSVYIEK